MLRQTQELIIRNIVVKHANPSGVLLNKDHLKIEKSANNEKLRKICKHNWNKHQGFTMIKYRQNVLNTKLYMK